MDIDFGNLVCVRPRLIDNPKDELNEPILRLLRFCIRLLAPYLFGSKHTDLWTAGRIISKAHGKNLVDARCQDGNWLCLPLPVYTSHFLFGPDHKRFGRDNITPLIKKLTKRGTVAIDVGASCGQEVVAMSHAVGQEGAVYCFEPSESFNALVRTVGLNRLKNVVCIKAACGARNGFIGGADGQLYFIGNEYSYQDQGVPVIRVSDFLRFFNETREVSLIKIDTDGFEWEVLQGCNDIIDENVTSVIAEFETHFEYSGLQGMKAIERYRESGFEVHKIQTSHNLIDPTQTQKFIEEMNIDENMIAHDIVLKPKTKNSA